MGCGGSTAKNAGPKPASRTSNQDSPPKQRSSLKARKPQPGSLPSNAAGAGLGVADVLGDAAGLNAAGAGSSADGQKQEDESTQSSIANPLTEHIRQVLNHQSKGTDLKEPEQEPSARARKFEALASDLSQWLEEHEEDSPELRRASWSGSSAAAAVPGLPARRSAPALAVAKKQSKKKKKGKVQISEPAEEPIEQLPAEEPAQSGSPKGSRSKTSKTSSNREQNWH